MGGVGSGMEWSWGRMMWLKQLIYLCWEENTEGKRKRKKSRNDWDALCVYCIELFGFFRSCYEKIMPNRLMIQTHFKVICVNTYKNKSFIKAKAYSQESTQ